MCVRLCEGRSRSVALSTERSAYRDEAGSVLRTPSCRVADMDAHCDTSTPLCCGGATPGSRQQAVTGISSRPRRVVV